jgi:hypothetical protein
MASLQPVGVGDGHFAEFRQRSTGVRVTHFTLLGQGVAVGVGQ